MNTLASARKEIKVVLDQAGYTVWSFIPERVTPPVVVLEPGSPYMNEGDAFTLFVCRFDLILLAATATNSKATEDLDQMIMDEVPVIPLYYDRVVRFVPAGLEGMESNPMNLLNLKNAFWSR